MNSYFQHLRVSAALVIRETEARYGSKPGGYLWAILDPLAHVAMMAVVFGALARTPPLGTEFALFFASGFLPFSAYQSMSTFMAGAVRANKNLFSYPIVSPFDAVVARYVLQIVTSILVTIVIFIVCTSELDHFRSIDGGAVVTSFFIASVLGLGVGLSNIALFNDYPLYEKIFGLINRPMFLLSGVIISPEAMPANIRDLLMWNPLVHMIMWFRTGIYPEYKSDFLDKAYLVEFTVAILFAGLFIFTWSRSLREDRI